MSGVWTITGEIADTLAWELVILPQGSAHCAHGKRAVYWLIPRGRRRVELLVDVDAEEGDGSKGVFEGMGAAQLAAERLEA